MKTKQLVYSSLIAALIFIVLLTFNLKVSNNIISFGYVVVFIAGVMFTGPVAGLGCGLGAMLFDIFSGYTNYAPFTFLAYGFAAYFIGRFLDNNFTKKRLVVVCIVAIFVKVFVYFIANTLYFGMPYAVTVIPVEIVNGLVGILIGVPVGLFLKKSLKLRKE